MTIDTNGFEIGDVLWVPTFSVKSNRYESTLAEVHHFVVRRNKTYVCFYNNNNEHLLNMVFNSANECQIACDELNSKM